MQGNDKTNSITRLLQAIKDQDLETVQQTLRAGVDWDDVSAPFHRCVSQVETTPYIVRLLIDNKADIHAVDADARTPLHIASETGNTAVASLLIEYNADVNQRDEEGFSPLQSAVEERQSDIVPMLVAHKADIDQRDAVGASALHIAALVGDTISMKKLIEYKADVDAVDSDRETPLFNVLQCENWHINHAILLLQAGADPRAKNENEHEPLVHAVVKNNNEAIRLLLAYYNEPVADPNLAENSWVSLFNDCFGQKPSPVLFFKAADNLWFFAVENMLKQASKNTLSWLCQQCKQRYQSGSYQVILYQVSFFLIRAHGVSKTSHKDLEQWFMGAKSYPWLRGYIQKLWGMIENPASFSETLRHSLTDEVVVWGHRTFLQKLLKSGGKTRNKALLKKRIVANKDKDLLMTFKRPESVGFLGADVFALVTDFLTFSDVHQLSLTSKQLNASYSPERLLESMVIKASVSSEGEIDGGVKPQL